MARQGRDTFISKGVIPGHNASLSATQLTAGSEDIRNGSPEGLVIRFRSRQPLRARRTPSDAGKAPIPSPQSLQYSGPVLKPKKAKSPARTRSSVAFKPMGSQIEADLPGDQQPKATLQGSRLGRLPTMLMLRLGNSKTRRSFLDTKTNPSLTLVNLECPSDLVAQLPVRITNIRPVHRPRRKGRGLEDREPICHLNTLSLPGQFHANSTAPALDRSHEALKSASNRRKVVYIKREITVEDQDPDYDQVLSSYYL